MSSTAPQSPIKLFHIPATRSMRIACLLEELNLPYELISPDRSLEDPMKDFKAKVGALGRVPTIHDTIVNENGEAEKIVVCESGAVTEYLLARYLSPATASLFPQSPLADRMKIIQYIHQSEATFMAHAIPIVSLRGSVPNILSSNLPSEVATPEKIADITGEVAKFYEGKFKQNLAWLENELQLQAKGAGEVQDLYLVGGKYTVADLMVGQALELIARYLTLKEEKSEFALGPKTREWLKRLNEREAWIRTKEKCT